MFWVLLLCVGVLAAEEVVVDLRRPTYMHGILYTREGGVVRGEELRIQARSIQYIQRDGVHRIEAEGDLLVLYKGRVFVGSELEYDFGTHTGTVYDGKTFASLWYIGGDAIQLRADGSYKVSNGFITTCENKDSSWDLHAGRVDILKQNLLEAKKVRFRLFKIPFLWLPSLKLNMKKFKEPFFRWRFNWDKGPLFGVRYQLYSWQDFALFVRGDYRWPAMGGGALETEYLPSSARTSFVTRSYAGKDFLQNAPNAAFRYRLQGALHHTSAGEKTRTAVTWDRYSDVRMPGDFKTPDFEVNTAGKTLLYLHHTEPDILSFCRVRPRANSFESIQQELPTLYTTLLPGPLSRSGILSTFSTKASYLRFAYSDQLVTSLKNFDAARVEVNEMLHRPIPLGPVTFTPHVGGLVIFYSDSPKERSETLALLRCGADLTTHAQRRYATFRHLIEPYAFFHVLTHPTVENPYIFSIQDGYRHIQQLQAGVRNLFTSKSASLAVDLYANAFISDPTIPQFIPRLYVDIDWRLPSLTLTSTNIWNFQDQVLDTANLRFLWTVNENIALALEGRYRSRYQWRKADSDNFILDVTRRQSELLLSPLSDQRITLLAKLFIRLTPFWELNVQAHSGFLRSNEKPYTEFRCDLFTWISAACKIRFTLTRVAKYNKLRPSIGVSFYK